MKECHFTNLISLKNGTKTKPNTITSDIKLFNFDLCPRCDIGFVFKGKLLERQSFFPFTSNFFFKSGNLLIYDKGKSENFLHVIGR